MSQQLVNIGGQANDGTGDSIRTAFDKINTNFTEVYSDLTFINSVFSNTNSSTIGTSTINTILSEYAGVTATLALFQNSLNTLSAYVSTFATQTYVDDHISAELGLVEQSATIFYSTITFVHSALFTNTNATSTTSGALQVVGGAGIGGDLYVGGNINSGGGFNAKGNITVISGTNSLLDLNIINNSTGNTASAGVSAQSSGTSIGLFTYPIASTVNSGTFLYSNNPGGLTIEQNGSSSTGINFVLPYSYDNGAYPRVKINSTGSILEINLDTAPLYGGIHQFGNSVDQGYSRGATITYTGGEPKFGNWRQYHNAEEWSWALVYNTAVNPHTVFPATYSARDTTDGTADIVFANRIDVAEGHSGQNFWGAEWAPANDTVPATQPDWAAGSSMRYYDGGVLALSNSWGNSAQWSSSGDPKYQPSGTFRDSAIQLISGETVAGPNNNGYSHVMRTSATDGSFKIQDVTAFKNSSTYWIPITPPTQVGILDRMVIDTSGNVSFPGGNITSGGKVISGGDIQVPSSHALVLFNSDNTSHANVTYDGTMVKISKPYGGGGSGLGVQIGNLQRATLSTVGFTGNTSTVVCDTGTEILFLDYSTASIIVVFPANPVNGQTLKIGTFGATITGITFIPGLGSSYIGAVPASITQNTPIEYTYYSGTSAWFTSGGSIPSTTIKGLGYNGETWHDVTASRVLGGGYTNSHTYPIMVAVSCTSIGLSAGSFDLNAYINGYNILNIGGGGLGNIGGISFIVPPGAIYEVGSSGATTTLTLWTELY